MGAVFSYSFFDTDTDPPEIVFQSLMGAVFSYSIAT